MSLYEKYLVIVWGLVFLTCSCDKKTPTGNGSNGPHFENSTQLTTNTLDTRPKWSPAGDKIAFERGGYVYTVEVASGAAAIMTEGRSPAWSFDGQFLIFIRDAELYSITDDAQKTVTKLTAAAYASYISGCDLNNYDRIAYFLPKDSTRVNSQLVVYNMSSNGYKYFSSFPIGFAESPQWSADNTRILLDSHDLGPCFIHVANETWHEIVPYGLSGKLCWLNTTTILYCIRGNLYQVDADGGNQILLYGGDFYPGSIHYSPQKEQLTFNYSGIWIMDLPADSTL